MEFDVRDSDIVVVRITLRGRDGGEAVTLNETVTVAELGLTQDGGGAPAPGIEFDAQEYARLMASGSEADTETALRMLASLNEATAAFVADGGTPPAESLAQAVVDWVVETRPQGHTYTTSDKGDGYVISAREINIHGPIPAGDGERMFRVTAVGTWGV